MVEKLRYSKFSSGDFIDLTAGANNAYNNETESVYRNLKSTLLPLKNYRVILGGVAFRKDLPLFHKLSEEIMKLNLYMFELTRSRIMVHL